MTEIDVSKCQYYIEDDMCDAVGTVTLHCSKNNCYYKQLQKLKQENEMLKKEINSNSFGMFNIEMTEKLEKIKDVCDECSSCSKINDILQIIEGEE